MVIDRQPFEHFEHVDRQVHVLKGTLLALLDRALEWDRAHVRVVPIEICVEGQEDIDQRLRYTYSMNECKCKLW